MPDLVKRLMSRRAMLRKIHQSPEWKAATKQFKLDHPYCKYHLKVNKKVPTFVPHHPDRSTYAYPELYIDLERSGAIPLCKSCHFAVEHGMDLCLCGENYKPWDSEACRACLDKKDPERVRLRELAIFRKEQIKREKKKKESELRKKVYKSRKQKRSKVRK